MENTGGHGEEKRSGTDEKQELRARLDELHTTDQGQARIKRNLALETADVIGWCREQICLEESTVERTGKNWYVRTKEGVLTIHAGSATVITAHAERKKRGNEAGAAKKGREKRENREQRATAQCPEKKPDGREFGKAEPREEKARTGHSCLTKRPTDGSGGSRSLFSERTFPGSGLLAPGSRVALAGCSNGLGETAKEQAGRLAERLRAMGLIPVEGRCLYETKDGFEEGRRSGAQRARELEGFFSDPQIRAVFDLSGGDLANEVLSYLDFTGLRQNPKPLFGYSDLTAVLNAVYERTGQPAFLYQARNLAGACGPTQERLFKESVLGGEAGLFTCSVRWIRGSGMEGALVGGNIRCLLKLAGTGCWPDMREKILFLESLGGDRARVTALLHQLRQMGVFRQIRGILLGTFTQLQKEAGAEAVGALACEAASGEGAASLPIAKTEEVGHGQDSRGLMIGGHYRICGSRAVLL